MSDFNNDKDFDLNYFSNSKNENNDSDDLKLNDLLSNDTDNGPDRDDEDFDLSAFSDTGSNGMGSMKFSDEESSADEDIDFNSFGKKRGEVKKESEAEKKKRVKKNLKRAGKIVLSVFLIGIITACLAIGAFAIYVFNFVDDTVQDNLDELTLNFTTTLYIKDKGTGEYVEYKRLHGEENRIWVGFDSMPENLKHAYIAVEDKRFNEHQGVDWKRTVSAFANMFVHIYSSNQGGSTITQQLVKNLTGDNKQSPMRKIREIMRARNLESKYEKDTILECYLNTISLGGGICGVEVAANYYFGKSTDELTLVECASLASLAKNPEKYRPDKNPQNNKDRRATVLKLMYDQGYITEAEYKEALETELVVVADQSVIGNKEVNSYFVDAVIDEVIDRLVTEHNYDKTYASKHFYNGGYKIYCTLDTDVQTALETEYAKTDKYFVLKSKKNPDVTVQSAMTVMDYEGHIVGIVGGSGVKTENRSFNYATMAYRQPGSTMKPLAAYSQALQKNIIHYSKLVLDSPLENYYSAGKSGPKNWYSGYLGNVTVEKALEKSINTIPCKLVKQMGVESTYYYLTSSLGLTSLDDTEDMNLSALGLGGTTTGITTTQSAAAFAIFGNLGHYYAPTTFTHMTDQHGNTVLKQKDDVQAIDENTASIMNHLLQNVVYGSEGTGKAAAAFSDKFRAYAKTGTSSDVYDCWFAGGTPYYVASCWFGFPTNEGVHNSTLAKTMWTNVMKEIHKSLEPKEFLESEFVTKRFYCASTGQLATDACPNIMEGYYKTNYSLPGACDSHPGTLLSEIKPEEPDSGEDAESGDTSETDGTEGGNTSDSNDNAGNTGNTDGDTPKPDTGGNADDNKTEE